MGVQDTTEVVEAFFEEIGSICCPPLDLTGIRPTLKGEYCYFWWPE